LCQVLKAGGTVLSSVGLACCPVVVRCTVCVCEWALRLHDLHPPQSISSSAESSELYSTVLCRRSYVAVFSWRTGPDLKTCRTCRSGFGVENGRVLERVQYRYRRSTAERLERWIKLQKWVDGRKLQSRCECLGYAKLKHGATYSVLPCPSGLSLFRVMCQLRGLATTK
jgi:hypothetical protein